MSTLGVSWLYFTPGVTTRGLYFLRLSPGPQFLSKGCWNPPGLLKFCLSAAKTSIFNYLKSKNSRVKWETWVSWRFFINYLSIWELCCPLESKGWSQKPQLEQGTKHLPAIPDWRKTSPQCSFLEEGSLSWLKCRKTALQGLCQPQVRGKGAPPSIPLHHPKIFTVSHTDYFMSLYILYTDYMDLLNKVK